MAPSAIAPAPMITTHRIGKVPRDENEDDCVVVESRNASGMSSLGNGVIESECFLTTVLTFDGSVPDSGAIWGLDNPDEER